MAVDPAEFDKALAILRNRLGREPTTQEVSDLRAVMEAGATADDIARTTIQIPTATQPTFPDLPGKEHRSVVAGAPAGAQPQPQPQPAPVPSGATPVPSGVAPATGVWSPGALTAPTVGGPLQATEIPGVGVRDFTFPIESATSVQARVEAEAGRRIEAMLKSRKQTGLPSSVITDIFRQVREEFGVTPDMGRDVTFNRFINEAAKWSPERKTNLQQSLVQAGLLEDGKFVPGHLDLATINALEGATAEASVHGMALHDLLAERALRVVGQEEQELVEMAEDAQRQNLMSLHIRLWGIPPAASWVESNMERNIFEVEFQERSKPAFKDMPAFKGGKLSVKAELAGRMGFLG